MIGNITSSMILGLVIAVALNVLFSGVNRMSGRSGQNISVVRFSSFVRTAVIAGIIVLLMRSI